MECHDKADFEETIEMGRKAGTIVKCIIVRCWDKKVMFAHVIPCKGADEDQYTATLVASDLEWMGYNDMILKHDNEKAI